MRFEDWIKKTWADPKRAEIYKGEKLNSTIIAMLDSLAQQLEQQQKKLKFLEEQMKPCPHIDAEKLAEVSTTYAYCHDCDKPVFPKHP